MRLATRECISVISYCDLCGKAMRGLGCRHRRDDVTAVDVGIDIGHAERGGAVETHVRIRFQRHAQGGASIAPFSLETAAPDDQCVAVPPFNLSKRIGMTAGLRGELLLL